MIYYWRASQPGEVPIGFQVPGWKPRGIHAKVDKIFERVRRENFPGRPSRLGAKFVCPEQTGFCRPNSYSSPGGVYEVDVSGKSYLANPEYYTMAVEEARRGDWSRVISLAENYWSRPPTPLLQEVVVQGRVTVLRRVDTLRDATIRLAYAKPWLRPYLLRVLQGSESSVTIPYLQALIKAVVEDPQGWGESSPAASFLRREVRNLQNEFSGVDPYPVSELWTLLEEEGIDPDEMSLLQTVPLPSREKARATPSDLSAAYTEFSRSVGKSVSLRGIDLDKDGVLAPRIQAWGKAILGLKKLPARVWKKDIRKVILAKDSRGSEDASYQLRGELVLVLRSDYTIPTLRSFVTHELGHAVAESTRLRPPYAPYGTPPFVSEYAKVNPDEDFAESFRYLVENPRKLKSLAPAKYEDLRRRLT